MVADASQRVQSVTTQEFRRTSCNKCYAFVSSRYVVEKIVTGKREWSQRRGLARPTARRINAALKPSSLIYLLGNRCITWRPVNCRGGAERLEAHTFQQRGHCDSDAMTSFSRRPTERSRRRPPKASAVATITSGDIHCPLRSQHDGCICTSAHRNHPPYEHKFDRTEAYQPAPPITHQL